ncbi:hypothetical protein BH23ACT7_BH23ACT7_03680 [soil metagenome]
MVEAMVRRMGHLTASVLLVGITACAGAAGPASVTGPEAAGEASSAPAMPASAVPPTLPATGTPAPPPAEQRPAEMFLSHRRVGSEGQRVALAMTPAAGHILYGIQVDLEHFDGEAWEFFAPVGTALTFWERPGNVHIDVDPDEVVYLDIGLSASPDRPGELEWVSLPALEPGWYRFVRSDGGTVRAAPFEVVDSAAPVGPDLGSEPSKGTTLEVSPSLVSGPQLVRLVPVGGGPKLAEGDVVVERAEGSGWVEHARVQPDVDPDPVVGNAFEAALELPELDAGAYRLTATDRDGTARVGYVFVGGLVPAGTASDTPSPTPSATVPPAPGTVVDPDHMTVEIGGQRRALACGARSIADYFLHVLYDTEEQALASVVDDPSRYERYVTEDGVIHYGLWEDGVLQRFVELGRRDGRWGVGSVEECG